MYGRSLIRLSFSKNEQISSFGRENANLIPIATVTWMKSVEVRPTVGNTVLISNLINATAALEALSVTVGKSQGHHG